MSEAAIPNHDRRSLLLDYGLSAPVVPSLEKLRDPVQTRWRPPDLFVAFVGIHHVDYTVGCEKDHRWPTTGRSGFPHPFQEAPRLNASWPLRPKPEFDEFLVLRFKAK